MDGIFGQIFDTRNNTKTQYFGDLAQNSDLYSSDNSNKVMEKLISVATSFAADPADYGTTQEEKESKALFMTPIIFITESMIKEAHSKGINW